MCGGLFGKTPKDNSAEIAAEQERKRQANVQQGRTNIDNAFSTFNDGFFDQYRSDFTGNYFPQLEEQYNDALDKTKLTLASRGLLTSSAGQRRLGELSDVYNQQKLDIEGRANDAVNQLQGNIANTRSNLYAQNQAAADPGQASANAAAQIGQFQTGPTYSALPDIFSSVLANYNNALVSSNRARGNTQGQLFINGSNRSGYNVN